MKQIKKILIAEDELLVGRVLKLVLERNNYQVKHVFDGLSVIMEASNYYPDLIILDVYLKNKTSGIEAGKEIRKKGISCPIVFTTGNSFEQTSQEIKEIENSHLFIKPVDVENLVYFLKNELK